MIALPRWYHYRAVLLVPGTGRRVPLEHLRWTRLLPAIFATQKLNEEMVKAGAGIRFYWEEIER